MAKGEEEKHLKALRKRNTELAEKLKELEEKSKANADQPVSVESTMVGMYIDGVLLGVVSRQRGKELPAKAITM